LDVEELAAWALEETGGGVIACSQCQPDREEPATCEHQANHSLTRLGRDILSYVLDLAVMYLDGEERHYHPKIDDIAVYLAKSPGQIMPALQRLTADGYLDCEPPATNGAPSATSIVYPTVSALRTIPAFAVMANSAVNAELRNLKSVSDQS
jgi:hypothetical protein